MKDAVSIYELAPVPATIGRVHRLLVRGDDRHSIRRALTTPQRLGQLVEHNWNYSGGRALDSIFAVN